MAAIYLKNTKSLTHGTTPTQIEGLLTVRESHRKTFKSHGGDGGRLVYDHTDDDITLAFAFSSQKAADEFMTNDESNAEIVTDEFGGTTKTYTIKNVEALDESTDVPDRQATAGGAVTVNARANFGESDTRATMITVT